MNASSILAKYGPWRESLMVQKTICQRHYLTSLNVRLRHLF